MNLRHSTKLLGFVGVAALFTGCDAETKNAFDTILQKAGEAVGLKIERQGKDPSKDPAAAGAPAQADPGKSKDGSLAPVDGLSSPNAKKAKEHAELLQEMYRVVYARDIEDKAEYGSLVDTLNQGASLEGVYNGFTHSSIYRKLEISNPGASPAALSAFGKELARLTLELKEVTKFSEAATQPLALPVQPSADPEEDEELGADKDRVIEFDKKAEAKFAEAEQDLEEPIKPKPPLGEVSAEYSRQFVGASIYTLKRVLGDEALKVMADKHEYREKFALWYSKWVLEVNKYDVDFGLEQRNRSDEAFHYAWALKASEDRLLWEVLNRLHRLLNSANKKR